MSVDATKPIPDHVEMVRNVETKKEFDTDTVHEEISKLPSPTGYRLLILPFSQKTVTNGGIHLAESYVEKERLATNVGFVISLGPDAYKDENKFPNGLSNPPLNILDICPTNPPLKPIGLPVTVFNNS